MSFISRSSIICGGCGVVIPYKGGNHRYCKSCAHARSRAATERWRKDNRPHNPCAYRKGEERPCDICGCVIVQTSPKRRYCRECSRKVAREKSSASWRKLNGVSIPIGATLPCHDCGVMFTRKARKRSSDGNLRCQVCMVKYIKWKRRMWTKNNIKIRATNRLLCAVKAVTHAISSPPAQTSA